MDVVKVFWGLMILLLVALWVEENWRVGTLIRDYAIHFVGMCYLAAMRHTGETRYTYKARRYRL